MSNPAIVRQPPSLMVVIPSDNVTITVEGFGGDLTYQWFKDGLKINDSDDKYHGTMTSELTITDVQKSNEGVFFCSIGNDLATITSKPSLLSVGELNP